MPTLPAWLLELKTTLPRWVSQLRHPDGPGRYRYALNAFEPYDINSSSLMRVVTYTIAGREMPLPSPAEQQAWVDYLRGLQRPEDGLLIDPAIERHIVGKAGQPTEEEIFGVRHWTSRNAIYTVLALGGLPKYPLAHRECFRTPEEMIASMKKRDWRRPWGAGSWAGAAIAFQHFNHLLGDRRAAGLIRAGVDWLVRNQSPESGAWSNGDADIAPHQLINGIFKIWNQLLPLVPFPVQYPDQVVDLCLRGLRDDPCLQRDLDACSIFDVALVLNVARRCTDHRRDEVAAMARARLPFFQAMVRPDGGLSYGAKPLVKHGGVLFCPPRDQAEAAGSALNCQAIALLCDLAGWRDELGWTPSTDYMKSVGPPRAHKDGACSAGQEA